MPENGLQCSGLHAGDNMGASALATTAPNSGQLTAVQGAVRLHRSAAAVTNSQSPLTDTMAHISCECASCLREHKRLTPIHNCNSDVWPLGRAGPWVGSSAPMPRGRHVWWRGWRCGCSAGSTLCGRTSSSSTCGSRGRRATRSLAGACLSSSPLETMHQVWLTVLVRVPWCWSGVAVRALRKCPARFGYRQRWRAFASIPAGGSRVACG